MPEFISLLRARLKALVARRRLESDLEDELRFHFAEKMDQLAASGLSLDEARAIAKREFGNRTFLRESCREAWIFRWLDNGLRDTKYAIRVLAKSPVFTLIAVLTLAFGIGANSAIFSVINSVVLQPLPYQAPGQLYAIHEAVQSGPDRLELNCVNGGNFLLWANALRFSETALLEPTSADLNLKDETTEIHGLRASANLFTLLGIPLQIGHSFPPAQDRMGSGDSIILTNALWRTRFHSDASIVGRTVNIDGYPFVVAGILPESFYFPKQSELYSGAIAGWTHPIEFFVNLGLRPDEMQPGMQMFNFAAIGRLRPGITPNRAIAEINPLEAQASKAYANGGQLQIDLTPLKISIVGRAENTLWMLISGAGLVLLLVCVNLAGLLIAKSVGRTHEISLRTALGASRVDILRQFCVEGLLLSLIGGGLGIAAAYAGIHALVASAPVEIPRLQSVVMDRHVLWFTAAISVAAGLLFSFVPALRLTVRTSLKTAGPASTAGRSVSRIHQILAASEIALCTVLLISALLIAQSFVRVLQANQWANVSRVITLGFSVPGNRYQVNSKRQQFYTALLEAVRNQPGVEAAGIVNALPFAGQMWNDPVRIEEDPKPGNNAPGANWRFASPDYFQAVGLRLRSGRYLTKFDFGKHRILISERLAHQLPRSLNPIGVHISWSGLGKPVLYEVIGVVADARAMPDEQAPSTVYVPYWEFPPWQVSLVVRTHRDPRPVEKAVQALLHRMDREIAIPRAATMRQILSEAVAPRRYLSLLALLFAASATFLVALGLYGLISLSASQRTREIGIRLAVGARAGQIFQNMISQAFKLAMVGLACGITCSWMVTRLLRSLLYEIQPADPLTFVTVSAGLLLIALLAAYAPARRATRVDPVIALKWE